MDKQKLIEMGQVSELDYKEIKVLGDKCFIKQLNAGELSSYKKSLFKQVDKMFVANIENAEIKLVILTLCDENKKLMFDMKDIELLKTLKPSVIDKIYKDAESLNSLNDEETLKN